MQPYSLSVVHRHVLAVFFLLASCLFSQTLLAAGVYLNYEILWGDVDGDGDSDYYFHSTKIFMNIGGGIPMYVEGPPKFALYFDSGARNYSAPTPLTLNDAQINSLGLIEATPNIDFLVVPDIDGNARPDLVIQGESDPLDSLVLLAVYNQLPNVATIPADGTLTLTSGSITIDDYDADGRDDLYVERFGNYGSGSYYLAYADSNGRFTNLHSVESPPTPDNVGNLVAAIQESTFVAATPGMANVSARGAAQYNIDLALPPAMGGMKPQLSLNYNSQSDTGELGMGWSVSGLSSIHRCAPSFATEGYRGAVPQSQSERLCLDGEKLVAINRSLPATDAEYWSAGTEYRTERESFLKIVSYGTLGNGPLYFKVWLRNGTVLEFGASSDSRLVLPVHSNVDTWGLNKSTDTYGNSYQVVYDGDRTQGEYFVNHIAYEPGTAIRFKYIDRAVDEGIYRADQPRGYRAGGLMSTSKLLDTITTYINVVSPSVPYDGTPVREYRLDYERGENTDRFRLADLTECGYDTSGTQASCARPTHFDWQPGDQGFESPVALNLPELAANADPIVIDLNNDGFQDFVWVKDGTWHVAKGSDSGYTIMDSEITAGIANAGYAQPLRIDHRFGLLVADLGSNPPPRAGLPANYWSIRKLVLFDLDVPTNTVVKTIWDPGRNYSVINYGTALELHHFNVGDFNGDGLDDFHVVSSINFHHIFLRTNANWNSDADNFTRIETSPDEQDDVMGLLLGNRTNANNDGLDDIIVRRQDVTAPNEANRRLLKSTGTGMVLDGGWVLPRGDGETVENPYRYVFKRSKESGGFFTRRHNKVRVRISGVEYYQNLRNGFFVDFNGDALDDYVVRLTDSGQSEGTWRFYLNQGGFFGPEIDTGISTGTYVNQLSFLVDYDQDGILDFVAQRPDGNAWQVLLTSQSETYPGSGVYQPSLEVVNVDPFQGELNGLLNFDIVNDRVPITTDINRDGIPDIIYNSSGTWKVMHGKPQQPDLLIRTTDGFGEVVEFDYSALAGTHDNGDRVYAHINSGNTFPQIDETIGLTVIKEMRISNGVGTGADAFNAKTFQYMGAKLDLQGRGFLGFNQTIVTDQRTGIKNLTRYHQTFPYIGLKKSEVLYTNTLSPTSLIADIYYTYDIQTLNNGQTWFPYLKSSMSRDYAGSSAWSKVENTFDGWGNRIAQTRKSGHVGGGGLKYLYTEYQVDEQVIDITNETTQWLLGFVNESSSTYQRFDDAPSKTVITRQVQQPGTLDVRSRTDFADSAVWRTTTYEHDTQGNITDITVTGADIDSTTAPLRTLISHDDYQDSLYPREIRNSVNHLTTATYDTRFGVVDSSTDPNGLLTQQEYDPFGRPTDTYGADDSHTAVTYAYCNDVGMNCPASAVYRVAVERLHSSLPGFQGAPRQFHYYDSLNRLVRTETMDFENAGSLIRVDQEYDLRGFLKKVTLPHAEGETSLATCETDNTCVVYSYDLLGRLTGVLNPDGGETTHTYSLHPGYALHVQTLVKVIEPDGTESYQTTHRYVNGQGQLAKVDDTNGVPIIYKHDAQGFIRQVEVDNNADTRITSTYDIAGNQTFLQDPDAGESHFFYDGFGQLRREIRAQGTVDETITDIGYDLLGRQVTEARSEGISVWEYDTQKIGLLRRVTGPDFSETYTYDSLSRLTSIDTELIGSETRNFHFSYEYDVFGRPVTLTYPSGLKVRNQYQTTGYLGTIKNDLSQQRYWKITDTNSRGQVTEETLGNGLITKTGFYPDTGFLEKIQTGDGTYHTIQNLAYTFDSNGNVRSRSSQRQNSSGMAEENLKESFDYDGLNRLETAVTTGLAGGDRTLSYQYNALGNLTSRSDVGSYQYAQTGDAGVHAVTSVAGKSFGYDLRGNMVQNGSMIIEYTSFDKPKLLQLGSLTATFKYGPDQARFYQQSGNRETYYLAGGLYEEVKESGIVTQKSYVGGLLVHAKAGEAEEVRYLHRDHLGSIEAITDENGNRIERLAFAPYGNRRMEDWSDGAPFTDTTTRGFTGHEHLDDFNLIHANGRVYDPTIGRFLSPDPIIQAPDNTQSFNRYSYVWNNPLSYTDPSGYQVCVTTSGGITRCTSGGDTGNGTGDLDSGGGIGGGLGDGFGGGFGGGTGGNPFNDPTFRLMEAIGAAVHNYHATIAANTVAAASRNAGTAMGGATQYWGNTVTGTTEYIAGNPGSALFQFGSAVADVPFYYLDTLFLNNLGLGTGADARTAQRINGALAGAHRSLLTLDAAAANGDYQAVGGAAMAVLMAVMPRRGDLVDLTAHRSAHILNRHRAGAGKPGKTEFPAAWSDALILHHVSDIATDPRATQGMGKWNSPYAVGVRGGIEIRVDFYPISHPTYGGQISTAYPINVPANP